MRKCSLPPGFGFHPTDVELVLFYLKRKVLGKKIHVQVVSEINMYKFVPWDLPDKACPYSKERQWYFFCPRDRKYGIGSRANRVTSIGFWKSTGNDKPVYDGSNVVGMRKTLVFYIGRSPHCERTNWVVHEYRLEDKRLADARILQDSHTLCRLFEKSGLGPKIGEQYGPPCMEDREDDVNLEGFQLQFPPSTVNQPLVAIADGQKSNAGKITRMMGQSCIEEDLPIRMEGIPIKAPRYQSYATVFIQKKSSIHLNGNEITQDSQGDDIDFKIFDTPIKNQASAVEVFPNLDPVSKLPLNIRFETEMDHSAVNEPLWFDVTSVETQNSLSIHATDQVEDTSSQNDPHIHVLANEITQYSQGDDATGYVISDASLTNQASAAEGFDRDSNKEYRCPELHSEEKLLLDVSWETEMDNFVLCPSDAMFLRRNLGSHLDHIDESYLEINDLWSPLLN